MNSPIGERLVATGAITRDDLIGALERQRSEGGRLGDQLLLGGSLNRIELYQALAAQWGITFVDLIAEPPDPKLIARTDHTRILSEGWTPWRCDGDTLVVCTTNPPSDLLTAHVTEMFGDHKAVEYVASTPWDLWRSVEAGHRERLLFEAADRLADERPEASAREGLTPWQQWVPVLALLVAVGFLALNLRTTVVVILAAANIIFTVSISFKTLAASLAPRRHMRQTRDQWYEIRERRRRGLKPIWHRHISDADLPIYTILVPAYKEANVVRKVISNIGALDYPESKLDVMLLLEADDLETIEVARSMRPPEYVRIVVVPPGTPQTKPRACNYGLSFARGKYVVIFDAEDRPEPLQLRKAVDAFERDAFERDAGLETLEPIAVVQASLHYFNADYNVLTRMFAIEYAHWFEGMLPGMSEARMPLPLGGTSNHFDTEKLREMGGWDPYNVTEDADAGLRASVLGYRVAIIDSTTGEEACAEMSAWIKQRTRWVKGYIVTAGVHTRNPVAFAFARTMGWRGVVGMLGLIMATPLAFMSYPIALGFTVATYVGVQFIGLDLPEWVVVASVITFVFGNILMISSAAIAARSRYNWRIALFAVFLPVYWLMHSVAAWRAAWQVVRDPHRWEKTPHGLSEDYESDAHV